MSNFSNFYNARSPNMAMARDPRSKFRKTLIFLILHLILGKAAKFLAGKLSTSEVISQKPHGGWKRPPSAFRVNIRLIDDLICIYVYIKMNMTFTLSLLYFRSYNNSIFAFKMRVMS